MTRINRLSMIVLAGLISVMILTACQPSEDSSSQAEIVDTLVALNLTATEIERRAAELSVTESPVETEPPTATPTPLQATATSTQAIPTATVAIPPTSTSTQIPSCVVQQDLNVRPGPGRAYEPKVATVSEGTQLFADAYNPNGFPPGGPWARAQTPDGNVEGWVSALPQYIVCDFDISSLPPVKVDPPSGWVEPLDQSLDDGNFTDFPDIRWEVTFSPTYLVQISVRDRDYGRNDGDGIDNVDFTVYDQFGNRVYQKTEGRAMFCIFGGDNGCSPWVTGNGRTFWGQGGPAVEEGRHVININANTQDGDQVLWIYSVYLEVP